MRARPQRSHDPRPRRCADTGWGCAPHELLSSRARYHGPPRSPHPKHPRPASFARPDRLADRLHGRARPLLPIPGISPAAGANSSRRATQGGAVVLIAGTPCGLRGRRGSRRSPRSADAGSSPRCDRGGRGFHYTFSCLRGSRLRGGRSPRGFVYYSSYFRCVRCRGTCCSGSCLVADHCVATAP